MLKILKGGTTAKGRSEILAFWRADFDPFRDLIENPVGYGLREKRGPGEMVDI